MPSRIEPGDGESLTINRLESFRHKSVGALAFVWGLCAYFPIGVMYLNLLLLLLAVAVSPDLKASFERLRWQPVLLPLALFVAWTLLAALAGDWLTDTPTRLFHVVRVALVVCLGLMLTRDQAASAFAGFFCGSVMAALIVALHHVWGLPDWALWNSLLKTRNNFSSGNMITMATAAGACCVVALVVNSDGRARGFLLALGVALGATVALHAISRNAQILLAVLLLLALLYRFRTVTAMLAAMASVALLVFAAWNFSPTTSERFGQMADDMQAVATRQNYSTSVGVRWRMYEEAVKGMVAHPVLGTGVGYWLPHWKAVWQEIGPSQPPEVREGFSEINNPHNDFLLAGMETGVPGMLLMAWWLAILVRGGWRAKSASGGITTIVGMSIVMTAMVNAPLRDAALGMTLLWLLGASVALRDAHAPA